MLWKNQACAPQLLCTCTSATEACMLQDLQPQQRAAELQLRKPLHLEPVLGKKRGHRREKPSHCKQRGSPSLCSQRGPTCNNEGSAQPCPAQNQSALKFINKAVFQRKLRFTILIAILINKHGNTKYYKPGINYSLYKRCFYCKEVFLRKVFH